MKVRRFAFILLVFAVATNVFANEINDFSIDENGVFSISGSVGDTENVNLFITEKESGKTIVIDQTKSENGKYAFSVSIEDAAETGGNFVFKTVPQTEEAAGGDLIYYTKSERRSVAEKLGNLPQDDNKINAAKEIIEENADVMSFNCPEFKRLAANGKTEELAKILTSLEISEATLLSCIRTAAGIVTTGVSENADEIKAVFEKYAEDIKPETSKQYSKLEDKTALFKQLAKSVSVYESPSDFYNKLDEYIILADINSIRGTDGCYGVLVKYPDVFDMTMYNRSDNDKTAMLKKILEQSENGKIESIAQIQKILDERIPYSDPGRGTGSSTGSSSGSSSGSYSAPPVQKNNYSETDTVIPETVFLDIQEYEWAKDDIEYLVQKGILNGVGKNTFAPSENVTRAEVAKMVCKMINADVKNGGSEFADVNESDWFCGYVNALAEKNVINGISKTEFKPNEYISRQDFSAILQRILNISYQGDETEFSDNADTADYAKDAALALKSAGIIKGDNTGRFNPKDNTVRAEAAVMISRSCKYMNGGQ